MTWSPNSWRAKNAKHIPNDYPSLEALQQVEATLSKKPPLVVASEIEKLKKELAKVARGESFLLQGGDCAESFSEFEADRVIRYFRVFLQMAVVLTFAGGKHVVKVGRVAGQFAKPRSSPTETIDGVTLPSYRGDNINGLEFNEESRLPDPQRLLQAYNQSASTMNLLRALATGGYADLAHINDWNLNFIKRQDKVQEDYLKLCHHISESLDFINSMGKANIATDTVSFFTSHEALLLGYEEALTRKDSLFGSGGYYATSAHMLWIGDRTRGLDDAHIEYCRGVKNPIGIKCGPSLTGDELLALIDRVNPTNEEGKLVLIARFGSDKIANHLPEMVRKVTAAGKNVIWSSDPMHGNTITSSNGFKTRPFDRVMSEVVQFMNIVHAEGAYPGGIHLEMTGDDVTECIGGAIEVTEDLLPSRYNTHCDPRLNASQSLELAFEIAGNLRTERKEQRMAAAGL
ncbi:class II 3-deoxy-7-phosphoheptulonate synthase [Pseudaquidulcibacter saccharophilus]|uniref:class II 3-deoxy-7-phosphoheptulonate synthase n=1 Tax=Pseudaquidulcibacter saccharophilus TaxID=2831900 RepID=UPI001EFF58C7|nr:3-deoxy-7-phosphoheptulonate synthase class II [Pseudaquidulcibacter saccharophilus]